MRDLRATEIKAFVPSKDFALSKRFDADLGFEQRSEGGDITEFAVIDPCGVCWHIGQHMPGFTPVGRFAD